MACAGCKWQQTQRAWHSSRSSMQKEAAAARSSHETKCVGHAAWLTHCVWRHVMLLSWPLQQSGFDSRCCSSPACTSPESSAALVDTKSQACNPCPADPRQSAPSAAAFASHRCNALAEPCRLSGGVPPQLLPVHVGPPPLLNTRHLHYEQHMAVGCRLHGSRVASSK